MKSTLIFLLTTVACSLLMACGGDDTSSSSVQAPVKAAESQRQQRHVLAPLIPVGGSGITGHVNIVQMPHGGVNISLVAFGLRPGVDYVSLYYDNHVCQLEPYSADD